MISVVVPAFNAEDTLDACLMALEAQTVAREQYEVIVADDGSADSTPEIARAHDVTLLRQDNAGPAAARNRGAREARGDLLLFTDADCAPAPDWIERLSRPFSDSDVVGAKGVYRTRQDSLVARFVQLEYEEKYARMARQEQIDFVDTYSAAYRRDVFLANSGFEPLFTTASVEDQEFSFRLSRKGYRLVFVPDAIVYHVHDARPAAYARRKFTIGKWKVLLLRWHPERAVRDSHTPQALKLQIVLVAAACLCVLIAAVWQPARWLALGAAGLFLLSSLRLLARILRRDPAVMLVAPFLLLVRALALGCGLAVGLVRFSGAMPTRGTRIEG